MTEYDWSPEALDAYNKTQIRIARWVDDADAHAHEYKSPFVPPSDSGDSDATVHARPYLPHRRSVSVGPPGGYNPVPAPPTYPPQPYAQNNNRAYNVPGPMPMQYPQYSRSPPPTMVHQSSLYRSQSQDTLSRNSHHSHSHRHKHKSRRSPTYIIQQTSPTHTPMVSPPLSTTSSATMWYPQPQQAYSMQPQATPPQVISPTHVPYVSYPYSNAAPMAYPFGYAQSPQPQAQAQPQPQYIVIQPSKSRKSSKSRKLYVS
jgi:hypothetical protein